jgi:hypothetical protein
MKRQQRRRIEREWKKVCLGRPCTRFLERNQLFTVPYVLYFQAIKIGDDLIGVYSVSMFSFKEGYSYLKLVTVCQFVSSLFRELSSTEVGFVGEEDFEKGEEIEFDESD